ncbi:MAG: methyltransferase domain-containing protein, partial [Candidatus Lokiarchaeota archaeon]|nr:methyltransferase domain-containing protein [Candidatus Lokiarchaeota archaeon]
NLDIPNESVDIITAFQSLHHGEDAMFRLGDMARMIKPNGIIIIKDHDVVNTNDANNISFEHLVYSIGEGVASIDDTVKYNELVPIYYYSADYIKNHLKELGLTEVYSTSYSGPTKVYVTIFKKLSNNLLEKEYVRYTYVKRILDTISARSKNIYESRNSVERWLLSMTNFSDDSSDPIFSTDVMNINSRFNIQLKHELIEKSGISIKYVDILINEVINIVAEYLELIKGDHILEDDKFIIDGGYFEYKDYNRQITSGRMDLLKSLGTDHEIARMLLRYSSILPGSQHWNMPLGTFKAYYERGIRIEGFASPVNAQLIVIDRNCKFCSLFPDVDRPFGSIGNFFTTNFTGKLVSVGPPYTVELFDKISQKIENECKLAKDTGDKVLFYTTFSAWEDTEGFQNLLKSKYTNFSAILPASTHFYISGNDIKEVEIVVKFDTVFFDTSVGHPKLNHDHLFDSMSVGGQSKLEILKL